MATYKVTLQNDEQGLNKTIDCDDDVFIHAAAKDNGIELPYTCNAGACYSCAAKLLEGQVDQSEQTFLSEDQEKAGYVLLCVASPRSNVKLKTHAEKDIDAEPA